MQIQITPSQLETFRKYHSEALNGFVTHDDVVDAVKRKTSYKPEMGTGEAYHKVIEFGHEVFHKPEIAVNHYEVPVTIFYEDQKVEVKEIFTYSELVPAIKYREKHKGIIWEVPNKMTIKVGEYEVFFDMRMDGMHGTVVHENKTVYDNWYMESYEDSLPWRIYLHSTGCRYVLFNIFQILEKRPQDIQRRVSHSEFKLYPNETIFIDIADYTELFISFLENNNLLNYVKRR